MNSWDSHMVPMLFSRAVISFGDPLYIAEDEDEAAAARKIEQAIDMAEERAYEVLEGRARAK